MMDRARPSQQDVLINVAAFQATWLAAAFGLAAGTSLPGTAAAGLCVGLHLWRSPDWEREAQLVATALAIGLLAEWLFLAGGFVLPAGGGIDAADAAAGAVPAAGPPPAAMVTLWAAFATLSNVTLRWLRPWVIPSIVGGLLVVPLAYLAAHMLGAVALPEPSIRSLSVIGLVWAVALPVLLALASRLDGWAPRDQR